MLRTEVDPDEPFANLIQRVRDSGLSAYAHADVPFERLVEALNPPRSRARHPLFQVALTAEISGRRELEFSGVKAVAAELEVPIAKFDIELMVSEGQEGATDFEGLEATLTYATDLFDASTMVEFAERFIRVLNAVVDDQNTKVGDIAVFGKDESARVLDWSAGTRCSAPELSILSAFYRAADAQPNAVAVADDDRTLTYEELDTRSSLLALELRRDRCMCGRRCGVDRCQVVAMGSGDAGCMEGRSRVRTHRPELPAGAHPVDSGRYRCGVCRDCRRHRTRHPDTRCEV